jgi:ankyrin repeat protein
VQTYATKELIEAANEEARQAELNTALRIGSRIGGADTDSLKELMASGADVNALDDNGWTAIHMAVRAGRIDVIALLVQRGADFRIRTPCCGSPVEMSASIHGTAHAITRLLLELSVPETASTALARMEQQVTARLL